MPDPKSVATVRLADLKEDTTGVYVRQIVGGSSLPAWDPVILFDHIGPQRFGPQEAVGASDHPHRGIQVISYVVQGGIRHGDSVRGAADILMPAQSIQLIHTGQGVIHYEMPADNIWRDGGVMEGFQIWLNLPKSKKDSEPRFVEILPEDIGIVKNEDSSEAVRVLAGKYLDVDSGLNTEPDCLLLDVELRPSSSSSYSSSSTELVNHFYPVPMKHTQTMLYVWDCQGNERTAAIQIISPAKSSCEGNGEEKRVNLKLGQFALFSESGDVIQLRVLQKCRCLILSAVPTRENAIKYGPFVMNSQEEIEEALEDYQEGRMGAIEGREEREQQNIQAMKACVMQWEGTSTS